MRFFILPLLIFIFFSSFCKREGRKGNINRQKVESFSGKRDVFPVRIFNVSNGVEEEISFTGFIVPVNFSQVSPKVSGRVVEIFADIGKRVRKGEILLKIDDSDYKVQLKRAEANLEVVQQQFRLAEIDYERAENLIKTNAISKSQYDQIRTNYEMQRARVEDAKVQYEKAKMDLMETTLRAPFDGIIVERRVDVGSMVSPQFPVLSIQSLDVFFLGKIPENMAGIIKIGDKVQIYLETIDKKVDGVVESIKPSSSGGFDVKVKIFSSGIPTNVYGKAVIPRKIEGVPIPYESLKITEEGSYVFSISDGTIKEIKVDVIDFISNYVIVNIPPGITQIVREVNEKLYDGAKVKIID